MIGTTLSHYKVLEKIGQGGMGEVYRAEDTNLSREVAIKVLPEQFTQDPQRLARFEREAKLLAQLNHPNIAAIYGFEKAEGVHFLALELVEGETLAERVAKGPLPVEEALEVCRQIAEGVEAAHEKGVIHRDLKPANVKVTPDGKVKILDFGLAKAFEEEVSEADMSQSPTLTEEMTRAGVILGTAAYMSPEQAKGKPVDKRADIFAFGCLLYELLTGKRAFEGETVTETIAAVLKSEPNWDALPGAAPWRIQELLRRCLTKDVHDRLDGIGNVRTEIKLALEEPTIVSPTGLSRATQRMRWRGAMTVSLAVLAAAAVGVAVWSLMRSSLTPLRPLTEFVIAPPPTAPLDNGSRNELSISSDGRRIVYLVQSGSTPELYVRAMDDPVSRPIPGTEFAAGNAFFSPNGESVAFFAGGNLKRVSLTGGPPMTLCKALRDWGGSWVEDTIVFADITGLHSVSAAGGEPESLAVPDQGKGEFEYRFPEILPGGKAVLFTIWGGSTNFQTAVLSLETGEKKILLGGSRQARYAPTGHLIYVVAETGSLMAVPFDPARLEVTGGSVPVLEGVRHVPTAAVDYTFSGEGTLVYVPEGESGTRRLVWVDRQGKAEFLAAPPRQYDDPRLSPDGLKVVLQVEVPQDNWIYDIARDTLSRLTFEGSGNTPLWTPDGKRVTFAEGNPPNLFWKSSDGSGTEEQLRQSEYTEFPVSWSPDGRVLAFLSEDPTSGWDIWILPIDGEREAQPFLQTRFLEHHAVFSPDGHWLAYVSDESGQEEVYVQPFPGPGGKWLISSGGGTEPVWSANGELFFRSGNKMMAVEITTNPTFSPGKPSLLFEGQNWRSGQSRADYDVTPDGQRFLTMEGEGTDSEINVILNWFSELNRLVPTN